MLQLIPGTTIPYSDSTAEAFSYIEPLVKATGGLGLSQVKALTGLEGSTIQNWVKRGWVSNPKDKKYNEAQLARILIINALRDCIMLDKIARLMEFVNGATEDCADDIVRESELFNYLCDSLKQIEDSDDYSLENVRKIVSAVTCRYQGPRQDSQRKLRTALEIMVLACVCGHIMKTVDSLLDEVI